MSTVCARVASGVIEVARVGGQVKVLMKLFLRFSPSRRIQIAPLTDTDHISWIIYRCLYVLDKRNA